MSTDQILILAILAIVVALFLRGGWRHDVVALFALLASVLTGLVPGETAFAGFGHPAVITVACVLVLSRGLQDSGAVDALAQRALPRSLGKRLTMLALIGLGAFLSAFMNNVGAMALLMPLGLQVAARFEMPPGKVLMPLAFGTILGGMTTLIGTPPNLIVSGFRATSGAGAFSMFDFTPVGLVVALGGLLLAVLLGPFLVPDRKGTGRDGFDTGHYFTEVGVEEGGKSDGRTLREVERDLEEFDAEIVGMVRNDFRVFAPNPRRRLRAGDALIVLSLPESLSSDLSGLGLSLVESAESRKKQEEGEESSGEAPGGGEVEVQEQVILPQSSLPGRTASGIGLRARFGVNLLAVSRRGKRTVERLRHTRLRAGDVLLLQGEPDTLSGFAAEFGTAPLAPRPIPMHDRRRAVAAALVLAAAIAVTALGLLPAAIAFAAGSLLFLVFKILPPRKVYEAVDWSVVVLLGALIPVAMALGSTGAADLLALGLVDGVARGNPVIALALVLVVTMTLSDFMNNAATAAMMCPIALSTAGELGVNPDAFLMAVGIGASCAFLTPIGHQNNTLIMGPGGFRFGDYWRLGLPMELLVVCLAVPMILLVWPL